MSIKLLDKADKPKKGKKEGGTSDRQQPSAASGEPDQKKVISNDEILALQIKPEDLLMVC